MPSKNKVLFISHDASRTGAPIVLLNFLEWLKPINVFDFEILLKQSGPLEGKFKEIATTHVPKENNIAERIFIKIVKTLSSKKRADKLPATLKNKKFDLIYINTVHCLELTGLLKRTYRCPVICHVHENNFTIQSYYLNQLSYIHTNNVDHFIAVSNSTKLNLIDNYDIPSKKISLVYEPVVLNRVKHPTVSKEIIKKELGISNEFIVGGSGLSTWRKGIDLFIQIAVQLNKLKSDHNIKLVWVGEIFDEFKNQFNYEAKRLRILDNIIFTGVKSEVQNYFQIFDLFALTSREDPFPLVALEAASQKKPILCFDDSGGIPELIKDEKGGVVVPYGDVEAMAKQILQLSGNNFKMLSMGAEVEGLIEIFDVNIIGNQLKNIISKFL